MNKNRLNKRAIGGNRVTAQFSMRLAKLDPFKESVDRFKGVLIFNVRGGCFFIKQGINLRANSRIFKDAEFAMIESLGLEGMGKTVNLKKIEIKLLGEKRDGADCGIIVKFVRLSEAQLDCLNDLVSQLPVIDSDSEPFPKSYDLTG